MGFFGWLIKESIKADLYGGQIRKAVGELKKHSDDKVGCGMCGKGIVFKRDDWNYCYYEDYHDLNYTDSNEDEHFVICSHCSKRCDRCGKIYCVEHVSKHRCKNEMS